MGSVDGIQPFELLSEHIDDQSLQGKGSSKTWPISDAKKKPFCKVFRLTQTGKNSSSSNYLSLAGVEFYGVVKVLPIKKDNKKCCIA